MRNSSANSAIRLSFKCKRHREHGQTNGPPFPVLPSCFAYRSHAMLNIIWEFHCKPERQAEFENIYKPDGKWSQLFSCSPGYQGTTLIRDQNQPCRYLCADHWDDLTSFQAF